MMGGMGGGGLNGMGLGMLMRQRAPSPSPFLKVNQQAAEWMCGRFVPSMPAERLSASCFEDSVFALFHIHNRERSKKEKQNPAEFLRS